MDLRGISAEGREIWGEDKLTLEEVAVRLGVVTGDVCRAARGADRDGEAVRGVAKELGNLIVSATRWADDLGYDPEQCVRLAFEAQRLFADTNRSR